MAEPTAEPTDSCPAGAVSVYFAPSESAASSETNELIARVGDLAASCDAGGVDVIAWIDPSEGQSGMMLALDRLRLVAEQLVQSGVKAERMRVGASLQDQTAPAGPAARNVRIILREGAAVKRADSPPPLVPQRVAPSPNAI